ncbi:TPA: hypothetical protein N0F65_002223 [Lagenidium giganteum]|uniref:Probable methylthioribulose-1-phosphate dehydratase n=1 Tax=Lagenidium giganteum TaxID=4803 RepID=A0AAV2YYJ6_9STRA|nr:TPA: hypothetical protein N0F65_002223 [Lagenidium giganteum]
MVDGGNAALVAAPIDDLQHELRLHYRDSPTERASLCILRELGVSVTHVAAKDSPVVVNGASAAPVDIDAALQAEHCSAEAISYAVVHGRVLLELRDAGDCWLRCLLPPGVVVTLPAQVFRRFVLDATAPSSMKVSLSEITRSARALQPRFPKASDALEIIAYHKFRDLVCELCRQFFEAGWVTGTGGSISIRYGNRIYMTPSAVQKERIQPSDLYVLDVDGAILDAPTHKPGAVKPPKLSDCSPLFLHAYRLRKAGAVLHSHGYSCNLVTCMFDGQKEFRITHQEMIKGLAGCGYEDELVVPIIENTPHESDLSESLRQAIEEYPKASAVLVRRHGIYVWGDSWEAAKRHAECLHYLFDMAIEMRKLQLDFSIAPIKATVQSTRKRLRASETETQHPSLASSYKYVLLDIEGTTTPITFVKDVLFPFAERNVEQFLRDTWETDATQADVAALHAQASRDIADGIYDGAVPPTTGDVNVLRTAIVAFVKWNIQKDRKITALKQLQGHIWQQGYQSEELKALVYPDVPLFLQRMQAHGVRVGIYSSGSRQAQRLLFKHSDQGDLRPFLSVYFDTKVGHKREAASYHEIFQSLGLDNGSEVLFVTDVIEEAQAATSAGIDAVLSVRPGNAPLPAQHPFRTVRSFAEL